MHAQEQKTLVLQIPELKNYARSLARNEDDADDLVQDCLERAIERFDQFRPGTSQRRWLFTIMHNIFCDNFRRRRRRGSPVPIDERGTEIPWPAPQPSTIEFREVCNGFERLPRGQRRLIVQIGLEGRSYEEMAAENGVAVGTIKSRVSRARSSLRARATTCNHPRA